MPRRHNGGNGTLEKFPNARTAPIRLFDVPFPTIAKESNSERTIRAIPLPNISDRVISRYRKVVFSSSRSAEKNVGKSVAFGVEKTPADKNISPIASNDKLKALCSQSIERVCNGSLEASCFDTFFHRARVLAGYRSLYAFVEHGENYQRDKQKYTLPETRNS